MSCTHECFESFPSLELGDLCSDTNPTVENRECKDPVGKEKCGMPQYKNTPFNNYMSYANDSCTDHFTPQQVARMHCYIDLDYQSWQKNAKPSFVPFSPRIIEAKKDRITLSWLPPLGPGGSVSSHFHSLKAFLASIMYCECNNDVDTKSKLPN